MLKLPGALLWIPTVLNLYLAASIACWHMPECRGSNTAQGDFELAMMIMWISLPIAIVLVIFTVIWVALRFATPEKKRVAFERAPLIIMTMNILAPGVLLYAL